MVIRFGTDGWRGVIGEDFTPENVAHVAQGFADVYPQLSEKGRSVIIGYDRRRQSKESAERVARVLTANNIPVLLSQDYCPTPCVSWMVKEKKAAAGVVITASHNPPNWNGIKFKESYGGAASADYLKPIEAAIAVNIQKKTKPKEKEGAKLFDPYGDYLNALRQLVDLEKIKKAGCKILYDPMFGAGAGFLEKLLPRQIETIHQDPDPDFGGLHPEPIQPYVNEAMEKMRRGGYSICLITDGDADRIGCVDENGNYVSAHQIFALILGHLVENKRMKGKVVKSISTTVMIDRLCKKYNLPLEVSPVGFKYISPAMKRGGVLMGGEESGGIGMPHHLCERDGLFCGLLLLERMAISQKTVGQCVAELQKGAGPCFYKRVDLKLPKEKKEDAGAKLKTFQPKNLAGKRIKKRTTLDGYHFQLEDESWLLLRLSGTEPLLRTYAEASSWEVVAALLSEAQGFVKTI